MHGAANSSADRIITYLADQGAVVEVAD